MSDDTNPPVRIRRWRVQETALVATALVAIVAFAKWAGDFIVPVVAGILLAYALQPLVGRLVRWNVPRILAATVILVLLLGSLGFTVYALRSDAEAVIAELPEAARKIRESIRTGSQGAGPLAHVQRAAAELDRAAAEAAGAPPEPPPNPPPAPVSSEFSRQIAVHGAQLIAMLGQILVMVTLAFFLLTAGDAFRRKLVRIVGPSLASRRVTVEILDEIDVQVQRYLLNMLVTNVLVGLAAWFAYAWIGLERAGLWGTAAAVLHFIPYLGTMLAASVVTIAALVQGPSVSLAVTAAAVTVAIALVLGVGVNTWLQGRTSRMNPVAVFVAVLFFGWLWGGWGLLIGAPLAAVAKTVADRIDSLNALGELLGEVPVRNGTANAEKAAEGHGA